MRSRTSPAFQRVSYLRVSTTRICLAQHFALRPDRLLEIPRAALVSVSCADASRVRLEIDHEVGKTVVNVKPWKRRLRRLVVEHVLNLSSDELCRILSESSPSE